MTYLEKLKDQRWIYRRFQILELDDYKCQRCHNEEIVLNIHHLHYIRGKEPWEYKDKDLITLCMPCHEAVTLFKISEEEIYNPWLTYSREKKNIPVDLSPREYTDRILMLSNGLSL